MVDEGDLPFPVGGIPYYGITDAMEAQGYAPPCPYCGEKMFPADDHGRFACFCQGLTTVDGVTGQELRPRRIPQVDTTGMTEEQKAKVPPIQRLDEPPTADEAIILFGDPDSPEYQAATQRIAEAKKE